MVKFFDAIIVLFLHLNCKQGQYTVCDVSFTSIYCLFLPFQVIPSTLIIWRFLNIVLRESEINNLVSTYNSIKKLSTKGMQYQNKAFQSILGCLHTPEGCYAIFYVP